MSFFVKQCKTLSDVLHHRILLAMLGRLICDCEIPDGSAIKLA